jgi:hypothetical protein
MAPAPSNDLPAECRPHGIVADWAELGRRIRQAAMVATAMHLSRREPATSAPAGAAGEMGED